MTKLLNVLIVLLALLLIAIIVYPQWKENRPVAVRIGCDSTVTSIGFIVTQQKQFFKNERVIPEFVFYADPQIMLGDLIEGKLEIAASSWSALLKRAETDTDSTFKVLASGDFRISIPIDAMITSLSLKPKLKVMGDLKKKRLGYPPQVRVLIPALLKNTGLKETDLKLIEIPNSALVAALQQNQIDVALALEPERTAALSKGMVVFEEAVLPKYIIAPFPSVAYVIKRDLIKNQRRVATKLKILLDGTVAFADANVEESREMFLNFYNLDKSTYNNIYLPQFQKLVEINKGAVVSLMVKLTDAGVLSKSFDVQTMFPEAILFRQ